MRFFVFLFVVSLCCIAQQSATETEGTNIRSLFIAQFYCSVKALTWTTFVELLGKNSHLVGHSAHPTNGRKSPHTPRVNKGSSSLPSHPSNLNRRPTDLKNQPHSPRQNKGSYEFITKLGQVYKVLYKVPLFYKATFLKENNTLKI